MIVTGGLKLCTFHIRRNGTINLQAMNKGPSALGKKQRRRSFSEQARIDHPREPTRKELEEFICLLLKQNLVHKLPQGDDVESLNRVIKLDDFKNGNAVRALFNAPSKSHIVKLAREVEAVERAKSLSTSPTCNNASTSMCSTSSSSSSSSSLGSSTSSTRKRGRPTGSLGKNTTYVDLVVLFLLHVSLGIRSAALSALQKIPPSTVRYNLKKVREALSSSKWRKEWLRFPRDCNELMNWTPKESLAKWRPYRLLGVFDCTYVWLQTSSNVGKGSMRVKTHSSEQYTGQPFLKYLTFTAPNGRLMFYYGPFGATISDNDILSQAIKDNKDLMDYINIHGKRGLVFLDRGFNHTDQVFEKFSIECKFKIPGWTGKSLSLSILTLSTNLDQSGKFSARDIQKQYALTSDREVVEQFHGAWRRFVYFQLEVPMSQIPEQPSNSRSPLADYVAVTFALANYFYNPSRKC